MNTKVPAHILPNLRILETRLREAVSRGKPEVAIEIATEIQSLFAPDRKHHRLLQAKLWAYEACLDDNRLTYAQAGLVGIREIAAKNTRMHVEATTLLAICELRQKMPDKAKPLIREVIHCIGSNISSENRRQQFHKRFIERIEEECLLSGLIGVVEGELNPEHIQEKAIQLIQQNSECQIIELIGNLVPQQGVMLLRDVRDYSIKLLPPPERKLLQAPQEAEQSRNIGKRVMSVLKRIAWKSVCDIDSPIYKMWSKKIPDAYNGAYFATALATSFTNWRIGMPLLVSGVTAIVMKYSAHEFCEIAKPKGMMIPLKEKDA